jgi:SAM-dependent methyltransferase
MKRKKWAAYPRYIFRKELALRLIKKHVTSRTRFLDIGSASGDFGITLGKMGYCGVMMDFSEKACKQAKENVRETGLEGLKLVQGDFFRYESDEKFGLAIMFEVLEHIGDDKGAVKKVKGLLADGGVFLLSVPARMSYWGSSDILAGHVRRYEKKALMSLLVDAGFTNIEVRSYGFPWLNMAAWVRNFLGKRALKRSGEVNRTESTKESGINPESLRIHWIEGLFNKYLIYFPMIISRLFNGMDLAEGYLVIAWKK